MSHLLPPKAEDPKHADFSTTAGANLFVDSTINTSSSVLNNTTDPVTFECSDGDFFRVGDLIRVDNEVMEITAISTDDLTVKRGMHGTTTATHAGVKDIEFPFFNCYHDYDAYATVCTDKDGKYKLIDFGPKTEKLELDGDVDEKKLNDERIPKPAITYEQEDPVRWEQFLWERYKNSSGSVYWAGVDRS